jgi:integrase
MWVRPPPPAPLKTLRKWQTFQSEGHREWAGEDVKDFVMLSIYTGLRISDVATFDTAERLKGWIPDWLVMRLKARERKHGPLIFRTGESLMTSTTAELWRVKIWKVFKLAGPFNEPATPRRFRHTFNQSHAAKFAPSPRLSAEIA